MWVVEPGGEGPRARCASAAADSVAPTNPRRVVPQAMECAVTSSFAAARTGTVLRRGLRVIGDR
jgi:hypothetical protein